MNAFVIIRDDSTPDRTLFLPSGPGRRGWTDKLQDAQLFGSVERAEQYAREGEMVLALVNCFKNNVPL